MLQERPGAARQRARLRVSVDTCHDLVRAGLVELLRPYGSRVAVDLADPARTGRGDASREVTVVDLLGLDDPRLRRLAGLQGAGVPLVGLLPSSPGDLHHRVGELRLSAQVPLDVTATDLLATLEEAADPRPRPRGAPGVVRAGTGAAGGPGSGEGLSEREHAILDLIVGGHSNSEMAAALHLSVNTVKSHVRGLYRKLGVQRRTQVVALVLRRWPERPGV